MSSTIEAGLFDLLKNDSGVSALVGGNIFFALLGKGVTQGIVISRITGAPDSTLDGTCDLVMARFQFDSYSPAYLTAVGISKAVRKALQDFSGSMLGGTVAQTIEVNLEMDMPFEVGGTGYLFRRLLDLTIAFKEAA